MRSQLDAPRHRSVSKLGGYERMPAHFRGLSVKDEQRFRSAELIRRAAVDSGLPADPELRATRRLMKPDPSSRVGPRPLDRGGIAERSSASDATRSATSSFRWP